MHPGGPGDCDVHGGGHVLVAGDDHHVTRRGGRVDGLDDVGDEQGVDPLLLESVVVADGGSAQPQPDPRMVAQRGHPRGLDPLRGVDRVVPAQLHPVRLEWGRLEWGRLEWGRLERDAVGGVDGAEPGSDEVADLGGDPSGVEDGRRHGRPVVSGQCGQQVGGVDEDDGAAARREQGRVRLRARAGLRCVHALQVCGQDRSGHLSRAHRPPVNRALARRWSAGRCSPHTWEA